MLYKTLGILVTSIFMLVAAIGLGLKFYYSKKANLAASGTQNTDNSVNIDLPLGNSPEDQVRKLTDQVDQLKSQMKNQTTVAAAAKEIDKANPALALFAPIVVDKTKSREVMIAKNYKFTAAVGKNPATLSFEFYNAHPDEGTQKGYIVAIARTPRSMWAYPAEIFNTNGPYLIDFEKGETFAIGRFRMVNTQFEMTEKPTSLQVLIFSRSGELIINNMVEVN